MTADELHEWLKSNKIGEVSCLLPDFNGVARGKSMTPGLFESAFRDQSLRIPEAAYTINAHGDMTTNDHIDETEKDLILNCDLSTIHTAPWTRDNTACVICDGLLMNQVPSPIAPRQVLQNIVDRYRQLGLRPVVGPEVEFYLISQFQETITAPKPPRGASGLPESGQYAYSLDAIDDFDAFFEELYEFSEIQNISIDTIIHEEGPCQFELNLRHGDAINVADQLFLFKRLSRHVARRHGIFVTFMAKPYAEESGSSMHLHQSIVDIETGRNVFANEAGEDSELFAHYIGGLQKFTRAAMPLIAPYTNSYNRFEAYMSAPTNVNWSRENRTVGFRVPESSATSRRIENRIPGSDVNPYLAIAASLVCGLIGIENKIERKPEFIGQGGEDERGALPKTLTESLAGFRESKELRNYLGVPLVTTFADVKQSEYEHRESILSPWDVRYLMVNV